MNKIINRNISTIVLGVIFMFAAIDYSIIGRIFPVSLLNHMAVVYIIFRLFDLFLFYKKIKLDNNFLVFIVFYIYNIISSGISPTPFFEGNLIFISFGALYFLTIITDYRIDDINFLENTLYVGAIITIIFSIYHVDISNISRFSLSFARYVDPNFLATGFILCTAILLQRTYSKKLMILNVLLLLTLLFIILLSGSRGGLIANLAVIGYYFIKGFSKNKLVSIIIIVVGLTSLLLMVNYVPEWIMDRFNISNIGTGSGRTLIWSNYKNIFMNNNLTRMFVGHGKGYSSLLYYEYYDEIKASHNMFIKTIIEGGIIGFITLICFYSKHFIQSYKNKDTLSSSLLFGLMVGGLTIDMDITRTFWIVFVIVSIRNIYFKQNHVNDSVKRNKMLI